MADAAVTPLSLDDVLDNFHPLRSGTDLRGKIVAVQPETADAATIVIKPGRDWVGHAPGQYLQVGVDVDGVRLWRCYSLTHGPRPDGHISITVKAIPDGIVSQHLVHRARAGQMIHLQQAAGDFVLPMPIPEQLLLVTAGSGITPVIGMLRNLFSKAARPATDITLVHVNQAEPDSIFKDELRAHAAAGHLRLVEHFDDRDGLIDLARLESLVPDIDQRTAYACGPSGLLDALEAVVRRARASASAPSASVPRCWPTPAKAAPSPSRVARSSTRTVRPRSSTPPKRPASSCPAAAGWASAWAACCR